MPAVATLVIVLELFYVKDHGRTLKNDNRLPSKTRTRCAVPAWTRKPGGPAGLSFSDCLSLQMHHLLAFEFDVEPFSTPWTVSEKLHQTFSDNDR